MNYWHSFRPSAVILAALVSNALAACGDDNSSMMRSRGGGGVAGELAAPVAADHAALEQSASALAPRLIRQAAARVHVSNLDKAVQSSRRLVQRFHGRVVESEITSDADVRAARLLIRVPADSLDVLIEELASVGDVRSVSMSSTDVSREYFDTQTRLRVKEETVRRLSQLIQRSSRVEDLVAVERELSRVTAELESLKGQIQYFDRKVAESDLSLHMTEIRGGIFSGALRPVSHAFRETGDVLARSLATLVYLVVFVIPWVLAGLLLWWIGRRVVRARRK